MPREPWYSTEPLIVEVTLDCSEATVTYLRGRLEAHVTGALDIRRDPDASEPRVRMLGVNRFFAAPTCDRIQREVVALLEERRTG